MKWLVISTLFLLSACAAGRAPLSQSVVQSPELLESHCEEVAGPPRVEEVVPGVWVALGYDLANVILIETDKGHVLVDAGMSPARALPVRDYFREHLPGPIRAIIYTHSHIDHIGGASIWLEEDTEIWATESFSEHVLKQYGVFQRAEAMRGQRQFGAHVPDESVPCSAIGRRPDVEEALETGFRMPTHTFSGVKRLEVGGRTIELVEAHGETHDQLFVWLPEERVLMPGDNYYHTFPNLYTLRGTAPRPVGAWIASLDAMRGYEPEVLLPAHTMPVHGSEEIQQRLRDYRDAIQWIRDDVVRHATAGKGLEEIVEAVALPPHLAKRPYLAELYGQVDWSARAIYTNELGWFDGRGELLYGLPASESARREVLAMGGAAEVLEMARTAHREGESRWAAHLLVKLGDSQMPLPIADAEWRGELADVLEATAAEIANTNGRAYLLQTAHELRHGRTAFRPVVDEAVLEGIPLHSVFENMSVRLLPHRGMDVHESVVWNFTDTGERFVVTIRHGVAELVAGDSLPGTPEPLAVVTTDTTTWARLALQIENPLAAVASGRLRIAGSQVGFLRFINRFDRDL